MANAAVTITGTPENPIFNFDIPQGEKGNPGGITLGTTLGAVDLNTITTSGVYRQTASANSTLANNYPAGAIGFGGNLLVLENNSLAPHQIWRPFTSVKSAAVFYERVYTTSWSPWRTYASSRVDQTAGRAIYQWDDLNNREQLVYGDTGNRRIESIIANGWVAGAVVLRRIGNTVSISGYYVNSSTATDDVWIQVSPGFRPMLAGTALAITKSTNVMATLSIDPATGNCAFPGRSAVYGLNGHFNASWTTNDPWPTTLPGTASGTIPNL